MFTESVYIEKVKRTLSFSHTHTHARARTPVPHRPSRLTAHPALTWLAPNCPAFANCRAYIPRRTTRVGNCSHHTSDQPTSRRTELALNGRRVIISSRFTPLPSVCDYRLQQPQHEQQQQQHLRPSSSECSAAKVGRNIAGGMRSRLVLCTTDEFRAPIPSQ